MSSAKRKPKAKREVKPLTTSVPLGNGVAVTAGFIAVMEMTGCRPARCHACGCPFHANRGRMAITEGLFVHWQCRAKPIMLRHSPAEIRQVQKEIEALGGLAKVIAEALAAKRERRRPQRQVEPARRGCVVCFLLNRRRARRAAAGAC